MRANSESITVSFADAEAESFVDGIEPARLKSLVQIVCSSEGVKWVLIGIVLAGHRLIRDLNSRFLRHDHDTDVLSFLIEQPGDGLEGEVYVDVQTAAERCAEFNVSLQQEVDRYVIHGILHLCGYDDATPGGRSEMQRLEDRYLVA